MFVCERQRGAPAPRVGAARRTGYEAGRGRFPRLDPKPYTLKYTPYTLNTPQIPKYTLNTQHKTLNTLRSTLNIEN